jgi:hypothetical protein
LEPSSHWARPASERSGRGRCIGPNAISGFIREADSAHAARDDRSGQSGGIDVLRVEYQGHKAAAHAANRLTRPHRHKPSGTAICVDHGCQSPRAFLIWEIWAKADICGQNTITATPRISPRAIISVARFGKLTDLLHASGGTPPRQGVQVLCRRESRSCPVSNLTIKGNGGRAVSDRSHRTRCRASR